VEKLVWRPSTTATAARNFAVRLGEDEEVVSKNCWLAILKLPFIDKPSAWIVYSSAYCPRLASSSSCVPDSTTRAAIEHDDKVRHAHRAEPMRDENRDAGRRARSGAPLDLPLLRAAAAYRSKKGRVPFRRPRRRRGLVEHQDERSLAHEPPGPAPQLLPLTKAKLRSPPATSARAGSRRPDASCSTTSPAPARVGRGRHRDKVVPARNVTNTHGVERLELEPNEVLERTGDACPPTRPGGIRASSAPSASMRPDVRLIKTA